MELVLLVLGLLLGAILGAWLGWTLALARMTRERDDALHRAGQDRALERAEASERAAVEALVRPISDTLLRVSDQLARAEVERAAAQAELREQVRRTAEGAESLRNETGRLVTALRRSEVRGRWGEVQLRRLVESSGLIEHVDFTEQHTTRGEDGEGLQRPDLVVHLADGRHVVVDAKVTLSAILDASAATDDAARQAALQRHADEVVAHVDRLSSKEYWRRYDSPEFAVLFLPADTFLSSALEVHPDLLERAFAQDVVLATPTTLLALLRTVSYAWRQDAAARNAAQVQALGRELYDRLATMGGHLSRLGASLDAAVGAYNKTIGSLESRVLVSARRLADLGVVTAGQEGGGLPAARQVTSTTRGLLAPETAAWGEQILPSLDPEVSGAPDSIPYR